MRRLFSKLANRLWRQACGDDAALIARVQSGVSKDDAERIRQRIERYAMTDPHLPQPGQRAQIRPLVRYEGAVVGGATGVIETVIDIHALRVRDVAVLLRTGSTDLLLLTLSEITVMQAAS